jgi:hypothetical protein
MGGEHENAIVKLFEWDHARRSRSSGASFHDPVDVTSDSLVIECEATENKSYSLKRSFWEEVKNKQYNAKMPALAVRFRDTSGNNHEDLMIISAHDLTSIMEELEAYRLEAIDRS